MIQRIPRDDSRAARARPLLTLAPGTRIPREIDAQRRAIEQLRERAEDAGRAEGYAAVVEQAAGVIADATRQAQRHLEEARGDALTLALAIAERVLKSTLARAPERYASMVAEALEVLSERDQVVIRAGVEAYALLTAHRTRLENHQAQPVRLEQVEDVAPWYTCIHARSGTLELGLEAQLERIRAGLR